MTPSFMTEPTIAYADFSDPNLWNGKYIPSLHTKKRWLFLVGGGGSGKSVHVAQKEIVHTYLADNRLMCVRKIKDTLKDSMF
jgi:phage terminase large subunit